LKIAKGAAPAPTPTDVSPARLLLILLVNLADAALLVKNYVEHLVLAEKDSAKLLFLHEGDGLELNHFEYRQEGHDHGVARGAGFEKLDEIQGVVFAGQDLGAQLGDHLRDGEFFVAQIDARDFFAALEDLLENFYEVDQRDDQLGVGAFVVVEGFVGLGPNVFFDLLFLVEEFARGSLASVSGPARGSGGSSILDLM
jgi:hypothetical protein